MTFLEETTNHDESWWMARVQQLISENTRPLEDGHGDTDLKWIHQLVDEVNNNLPPPDPPYDGNMGMAARLSAILGLWFSQTQYAKTQDPNRPTFVRQRAYQKLLNWAEDFIINIFDHSASSAFFPSQKWQDPFIGGAESGSFL